MWPKGLTALTCPRGLAQLTDSGPVTDATWSLWLEKVGAMCYSLEKAEYPQN
jgi:hypothetical protein